MLIDLKLFNSRHLQYILSIFFAGTLSFQLLGDPTLPFENYDGMLKEAQVFILACYSMADQESLTDARILCWKKKMGRGVLEPPKLCSLPPTIAAFHMNALRAHLQVAVWLTALEPDPPNLRPEDHGWSRRTGSDAIRPTVVPEDTTLAPPELLRLVKCACDSLTPCLTRRCTCSQHGVPCTLFCICQRGGSCCNKYKT